MFAPNRYVIHKDQVPEHFKELFIETGYRHPGSSIKQCLQSVLIATNETWNFWTHFVPALYYWYISYYFWAELDIVNDTYTWPFGCHLLVMCIFPVTSALAHVFNVLSHRARHICFFFDYTALSIFTIGASLAYKAYIFPEELVGGMLSTMFLPVAVINAVGSLIFCCQTRFMPNRWSPGQFDIIGHSHQLFHVFTIIGCYLQCIGLKLDTIDRREELIQLNTVPSPFTCLSVIILVLITDVIVLAVFIYKICHVTPKDPTWRYLYGDRSLDCVHGPSYQNLEKLVYENSVQKNDVQNGLITNDIRTSLQGNGVHTAYVECNLIGGESNSIKKRSVKFSLNGSEINGNTLKGNDYEGNS